MKNKNKKQVDKWLKISSYIFVGLTILFVGFVNLIGGIIALACGDKCSVWALKINENLNVAYVIGFLFGLFGLLGYWIYYKRMKTKEK